MCDRFICDSFKMSHSVAVRTHLWKKFVRDRFKITNPNDSFRLISHDSFGLFSYSRTHSWQIRSWHIQIRAWCRGGVLAALTYVCILAAAKYISIYTYVCTCVHMCIAIYVWINTYACVCVYIYIYAHTQIYTYMHINTSLGLAVLENSIYLCVYVSCMHACMYTHTNKQTCMHKYIHSIRTNLTYVHSYILTHAYTNTHAYANTHTRTHTRAYTHANVSKHTHAHTYTHTHTHLHIHTHAHARTYTQQECVVAWMKDARTRTHSHTHTHTHKIRGRRV